MITAQFPASPVAHARAAVPRKLVGACLVALLAGACSLRSPLPSSAYSALPPMPAPPLAPATREALPEGFSDLTLDRTPRDTTLRTGRSGRAEPGAVLVAARQARARWETLRPTVPAIPPTTTGSLKGGKPTATAAPEARHADYDRDAAMQTLIVHGKAAGRHICEGC